MKKIYLVAGLTGAAVLMGGCAASTPVSFPSTIEVSQGQEEHTVTVESTETVMAVPDIAEVMFTVRTEGQEANVCQQENQAALERVLEYLESQGLEENSIQTSGYSLNPVYNWTETEGQVLTGYEMATQITVSGIPMEQTGEILSGAVDAGANSVDYVRYLCSTYDDSYQEALKKAVESAKAKAEAMGEAGNFQVLQVASIEEYRENQSARYIAADYAVAETEEAAGSSNYKTMDVAAGELEIQASIQVTFVIQE